MDERLLAQLAQTLAAVRASRPLVHHITNYVTVNDCANAVLAIGGAPVMADDEAEAGEIASIASCLVINIGTLNACTVRSMMVATAAAQAKEVPLVLDPVGAGASALRREVSRRLVAERTWTIIRGNLSEISTIAGHQVSGRGVDSDAEANIEQLAPLVKNWSQSLKTTVAVTGPTDVISDGSDVILVHNGHPLLPSITGTGCMVTALTGAFAGANPKTPLLAAAGALLAMGVAGERAAATLGPEEGPGTLRVRLIDALSRLTPDLLIRHGRVEYACV